MDEIRGFWKNTYVNFQEELTTFNVFRKIYKPLTTNWEKKIVLPNFFWLIL